MGAEKKCPPDPFRRAFVRPDCRFPVASDEDRTVARDGKGGYYGLNLNPERHVERMLGAVRALCRPPGQ